MSSSDDEDDCYGNAAQRLRKMKSAFKFDAKTTDLLNDDKEIDEILKNAGFTSRPAEESPKNRAKKAADTPSAVTMSTEKTAKVAVKAPQAVRKRMTRSAAKNAAPEPVTELPDTPAGTPSVVEEPPAPASRGRRGNQGNKSQNTAPRGRGGRGRLLVSTLDGVLETMPASTVSRGRPPRRGRGRNRHTFSSLDAAISIFSVGNTHEYPDECHSQKLFSNPLPAVTKDTDVIEVDMNDSFDDNEELSVKVYWQSSDFFRFNIRKFQKISQIFDYFSKKENVSFGNLLFTFNDRILKPDDTPDSMNYNIAKFIDGGVVSKNVSELLQSDTQKKWGGVQIKFQCQNVKKPVEISVYLDECLAVAMQKCAEHLELSRDKLKFYFDGDILSGMSTARELELEGGECIDVKIMS